MDGSVVEVKFWYLLPIYLFIYLTIYLSIYLFIYPSICSICLPMAIRLSTSVSADLRISPGIFKPIPLYD